MPCTDNCACRFAALISDSEKTMSGNLPRVSPLLFHLPIDSLMPYTSAFASYSCAASVTSHVRRLHTALCCSGTAPALLHLMSHKLSCRTTMSTETGMWCRCPTPGRRSSHQTRCPTPRCDRREKPHSCVNCVIRDSMLAAHLLLLLWPLRYSPRQSPAEAHPAYLRVTADVHLQLPVHFPLSTGSPALHQTLLTLRLLAFPAGHGAAVPGVRRAVDMAGGAHPAQGLSAFISLARMPVHHGSGCLITAGLHTAAPWLPLGSLRVLISRTHVRLPACCRAACVRWTMRRCGWTRRGASTTRGPRRSSRRLSCTGIAVGT